MLAPLITVSPRKSGHLSAVVQNALRQNASIANCNPTDLYIKLKPLILLK
jgi:hypothetical protein